MEPRIQYAQTADGVSIAFSTLGKGMPFIQTPVAFCGVLQVEWQIPEIRAWDERVAQNRMLVKYDSRGTGLSQRRVADCSLDAMVRDVEAVADCLELPSFALMGSFNFGPVAIAYAARHPERVSHLILWCTYARFSEVWTQQLLSMRQLVEGDWNLYTETLSHAFAGFPAGGASRQLAAMVRKTVTQEEYLTAYGSVVEMDVSTLLPEVSVSTLVLHRRELPMLSVNAATYLASEIPAAQLAILEGSSGGYVFEDSRAVLRAIDEFLGEGEEEAAAEAAAPEAGAFRTILFTDVEGSTALTQRLGDARARELLRQHERIVREALKAHGGSEVKTTGDGFMTSFSSATRALECAIAMQRSFAAHNEMAAEPILVRVGLNAGEPIAEEEDLFGTAVIMAARICGHAEAGQILAANVVRELTAGKDFLFIDRGEVALRGFDEPVRLYEVAWREGG